MKKSILILASISVLLLNSCKKEYVCECFNPGGVFKTYSIKNTKAMATKKCSDYSKEYQTIPWSETGCTLK